MDIFLGIDETLIVNTHLGIIRIETSKEHADSNKRCPKVVAVSLVESPGSNALMQRHDDYMFLTLGDTFNSLDRWLRPVETKSG